MELYMILLIILPIVLFTMLQIIYVNRKLSRFIKLNNNEKDITSISYHKYSTIKAIRYSFDGSKETYVFNTIHKPRIGSIITEYFTDVKYVVTDVLEDHYTHKSKEGDKLCKYFTIDTPYDIPSNTVKLLRK